MAARAEVDTLRSLAHGSISGAYAAVGTAFTTTARIARFVNNTDGDMIFSDDSSNATGKLFLPKGTFVLFDLTTNSNPNVDDSIAFPIGQQWYVKQSTAPSSGGVYIEVVYAV